MPIICRLLKLSSDDTDTLINQPEIITELIKSLNVYSDIYRYWHAIQYLLNKHSPSSLAVNFLNLGIEIPNSSNNQTIPVARVIPAEQLKQLNILLQTIEPDDLIPYYEASELDVADIYPQCWQAWEETFDPLGQVLEHYFFLQEFVKNRVLSGDGLLLYFEFMDDGSDYNDETI